MPAIEMRMPEVSAAELAGNYRAARARLWGPPPRPMPVELAPAPSLPPPKLIDAPRRPPDPLDVLTLRVRAVHRVVADHFGVTLDEIRGLRQFPRYVRPRHIAAYICSRHFGLSLPLIGRWTRRHHSSVLHGRTQIECRIACDPALAAEVAALVTLCKPRE